MIGKERGPRTRFPREGKRVVGLQRVVERLRDYGDAARDPHHRQHARHGAGLGVVDRGDRPAEVDGEDLVSGVSGGRVSHG